MSSDKFKGFATKTIHGGNSDKHNPKNALNYPIFQTSTFTFENLEHVEKVMSFESDDYVYTRGNNPTLRVLENRIAELEEGSGAVAFASGMAAISSVIFSLVKPGDKIIGHKNLYGSSYSVISHLCPKFKIEGVLTDLTKPELLKTILSDNVKVIYFESPSNPSLDVIDIAEISRIAKEYDPDIKIVVDNTFMTPYFQKPLTIGADIVVHSATKYINGHGDVVAGLAIANDNDYIMKLKFDYMCEFGGVLSPFNAWLIIRGLKTLTIRMDKHAQNALKIATFLENHPKIKSIIYPGLASFKHKVVRDKQMTGDGAIITFELKGNIDDAAKFTEALNLFKLAVSLGDCESLVEFPAAMTHRGYNSQELEKFGLSQTMIRLSVGLENDYDLIKDISDALELI